MSVNTEIERKYLIIRPADEYLSSLPRTEITQTYLKNEKEGVTERVRKRGLDGSYVYTHTIKKRIDFMSSMEDEREIPEEKYLALLTRADTELNTIFKTRALIQKGGFTFEIDVYPFWHRQAVMEVELPSEETEFTLPETVTVLREVTGVRAYSNARMARQIPPED